MQVFPDRAEEKIGKAEEYLGWAEEKISRAEEYLGLFFLSPSKAEDSLGHKNHFSW